MLKDTASHVSLSSELEGGSASQARGWCHALRAAGLWTAQVLYPPPPQGSVPAAHPQLQPPGKHNNQQLHTDTFGTTLLLVPECRLSVQEQKKKEHLKNFFTLGIFFLTIKKKEKVLLKATTCSKCGRRCTSPYSSLWDGECPLLLPRRLQVGVSCPSPRSSGRG